MTVSAWIIFLSFGLFSLESMLRYLINGLSGIHACLMFISIIITALSAGVIWGGLLG